MTSYSRGDFLVAVIGLTGAGKTTFISKATGRTDLQIGYSPNSFKKDISISELQINNRTIKLIDTPGFDDTELFDVDVLNPIADWLKTSYDHGILLSGLILLQPINVSRSQGSEVRRMRLFEKACGPNAFGNIAIATTMWSNIPEDQGSAWLDEQMGSDHLWDNMVQFGAKVWRHYDTQESALQIIGSLVNNSPVVLQIQTELHANNGNILMTAAGQQLHSDLGETSLRMRAQLDQKAQEMSYASGGKEELQREIGRQ